MESELFIGLMSGTSLDGVDVSIIRFCDSNENKCEVLHSHYLPYSLEIRNELLALHFSGTNELERAAILSNQITELYAKAVNQLLSKSLIESSEIIGIGCHGQTIRHRPELGFSIQICNPSLLVELTKIRVICDFRSRDIAAGGQGAPLVPAFHQAVFSNPNINRVIINIGGISNISYLSKSGNLIGFDSGPGNLLMDSWTNRHLGKHYDEYGQWALSGSVIDELLSLLLEEPYLKLSPPKSTGRDLFSQSWLDQYVNIHFSPNDVQRTLLEFTALTISNAVSSHCKEVDEIYHCGGGAHNTALFKCLQEMLHPVKIGLTDELGIPINTVEAAAFAWLARQTILDLPGNLPQVTGAKGFRVLGAIYAL